jgi:hypothetical protein
MYIRLSSQIICGMFRGARLAVGCLLYVLCSVVGRFCLLCKDDIAVGRWLVNVTNINTKFCR